MPDDIEILSIGNREVNVSKVKLENSASGNFRSARLKSSHSNQLRTVPSFGSLIFLSIFGAIGLAGMGFGLWGVLFRQNPSGWLAVGFFSIFFVAAVLGWLFQRRCTFDRSTDTFLVGNSFSRTAYPLEHVVAIQLIDGGWSEGKGSHFVYQVNVVLIDEQVDRVNLTTEPDAQWSERAAIQFSEFLDVPFLNHGGEHGKTYLGNMTEEEERAVVAAAPTIQLRFPKTVGEWLLTSLGLGLLGAICFFLPCVGIVVIPLLIALGIGLSRLARFQSRMAIRQLAQMNDWNYQSEMPAEGFPESFLLFQRGPHRHCSNVVGVPFADAVGLIVIFRYSTGDRYDPKKKWEERLALFIPQPPHEVPRFQLISRSVAKRTELNPEHQELELPTELSTALDDHVLRGSHQLQVQSFFENPQCRTSSISAEMNLESNGEGITLWFEKAPATGLAILDDALSLIGVARDLFNQPQTTIKRPAQMSDLTPQQS